MRKKTQLKLNSLFILFLTILFVSTKEQTPSLSNHFKSAKRLLSKISNSKESKPIIKEKPLNIDEEKKKTLAAILSFLAFVGIAGFIIYKFWEVKERVRQNRLRMNDYQKEINAIEAHSDQFVVSSLEDKRAGIIFFENPLSNTNYMDNITKIQELNKKLHHLKEKVVQGETDIENLRERNDWYKNEIKDLMDEYERKKLEEFDIGHAHGYADSLFKEFD